jgi:predicted pyridoxine 5'-phosphate oxidase superfamily flavin-nucleotide-binding protein
MLYIARSQALENAEAARASITGAVPVDVAEFLARQRTLVIGADATDPQDGKERVWASQLHGAEGFVHVTNPETLAIAARPAIGDPLERAFERSNAIGTIALEPQTRERIRMNGCATRNGDGLEVSLGQVFYNCTKFIATRDIAHVDGHPLEPVFHRTLELDDRQRSWITAADTFFVATYAASAGADASHRGGNPGFVRVVDATHLVWPDYIGNQMYLTLGKLELDPRAGLLFFDWDGNTLQLSGTARVVWDPAYAKAFAGAQRLIVFTIERVVETRHATPLHWKLLTPARTSPVERASAQDLDAAAAAAVHAP